MNALLLLIALALSLAISYFQTRQLVGGGSDHPTHLFLARAIRENKHRLFVRIPHLLNETHCSASPLFLHWCLSFLSDAQILTVSRILNPVLNALVLIVTYLAALQFPGSHALAGWITLILAVTPQFHHAYSARNYGLSSRSIGLLLFAMIALFLSIEVSYSLSITEWCTLWILGYLIWGFSTFAAQALLLIGTCMAALFGDVRFLVVAVGSVSLFIAIHPRYALSYLKYTFLFMKAYATELADVFILKKRYSVWRDFIYDIWVKARQNLRSSIAYTYENPVIIGVGLNPLILFSVWAYFRVSGSFQGFFPEGNVVVAGFIVFVLTSFRITRFLGEPERYLEMVTPSATIFGVWILHGIFGKAAVLGVFAYGLVWTVAQLIYAHKLSSRLMVVNPEIAQIQSAIQAEFQGEAVRFCANDEQITKSLMNAPWSFVRIWSAEQRFGGVGVKEAFSAFPFLRQEPLEKVLAEYKINACALNKNNFSTLFGTSSDRQRLKVVADTGQYRVYRITW